jgi:hypothetical protein
MKRTVLAKLGIIAIMASAGAQTPQKPDEKTLRCLPGRIGRKVVAPRGMSRKRSSRPVVAKLSRSVRVFQFRQDFVQIEAGCLLSLRIIAKGRKKLGYIVLRGNEHEYVIK